MTFKSGKHFLQIPGPSNVPDRVLRAIDHPTIDHRGPDFGALATTILADLKHVFKTNHPVVIFPASGTGAWEAALVNTLSLNDKVLMFETGHFASLWRDIAKTIGFQVDFVSGDWRHGVSADKVEQILKEDKEKKIKAVCVVHNETSTGVTSNIKTIRKSMDSAQHPALLLVDTISSLASIEYCHDDWGVDVTVGGSQKGLMLPPGLSFNALSEKSIAASKKNKFNRSYWDWQTMLRDNRSGFFPYTPATNLFYGLREALDMLFEEGLENVFARHAKFAKATRLAAQSWGLEILCKNESEYSNTLTAIMVPDNFDADELRKIILEEYNMSLGTGLGKVKGKVFRIGHLGDFNELALIGTLAGVEMGLTLAKIPHQSGGVTRAMSFLTEASPL